MPRNAVSNRNAAASTNVASGRPMQFNFANSLTFSAAGNSYGGVAAPVDVHVSSRTLEWWTAFDVVPTGTSPIFSLASANYYIGFSTNCLFISYSDATPVQRTASSTTFIIRPRVWNHYAVTFNTSGSNVDVSFYVDGVFLNTNSLSSGHSSAYGGLLYLGAFSPGALNLDGKMANMGFYNRALTAAEVLARSRNIPVTSGIVHRWLFSEGSGGNLGDSVGSTTFILVNSPTWSSTNVPMKARAAVS